MSKQRQNSRLNIRLARSMEFPYDPRQSASQHFWLCGFYPCHITDWPVRRSLERSDSHR
ncbi:hypothetical protein Mal52_19500 [Symmachiella dynata]|uniref:Uncharacterized protein n=1 Tax=Symmachiella dynata TaxID=2527995 RepID=A0A517ZM24_9PLAN|nr:hypothetical protein Mal52_19500 [Symmachiella dynata]